MMSFPVILLMNLNTDSQTRRMDITHPTPQTLHHPLSTPNPKQQISNQSTPYRRMVVMMSFR